MKKKRKEFKSYYWRIRTYEGTPYVGMWLVGTDGTIHSGQLYGVVHHRLADDIVEFSQLEVKRESVPFGLKKSDRKEIQKKVRKGQDWNQVLTGGFFGKKDK